MLLDLEVIKNIVGQVEDNLKAGKYKQAALSSRRLSSMRVASILMQTDKEVVAECLKEMDKKRAGIILANMAPEFAVAVLFALPQTDKDKLLNSVSLDHLSELLEAASEKEREELISGLDSPSQKHMAKVSRYPVGSAGRMMNPYFLSVNGNQSVSETLESIVAAPPNVERTPYIYVLDSAGKPSGVVSIKDLLRVGKERKVGEIMNTDIAVVGIADNAKEAAETIRKRRLMMLPVVDDQGFIVGVITFDDAMKVLSEDTINIFSGMAGNYEESFFTPPLKAIRSRLPWMGLNVFLNMGAVAIISGFEATIATVAILAAFIPMITDMGGNVGIQSLSVAIRSIALGEAGLKDFRKVFRKEVAIGVLQGSTLGFLFALIAFVLRGNPFLGLVAGVALGLNVIIAGVVGGILPFVIKALGKDPAMMTGPFLTTITDISGVTIYLALATVFIRFL